MHVIPVSPLFTKNSTVHLSTKTMISKVSFSPLNKQVVFPFGINTSSPFLLSSDTEHFSKSILITVALSPYAFVPIFNTSARLSDRSIWIFRQYAPDAGEAISVLSDVIFKSLYVCSECNVWCHTRKL